MKDRILPLLLDLLSIKSDFQSDKMLIVDFVRKTLKDKGFETSVCGDRSNPCLIASWGSGGIAFSGHLDTVPVGSGWSRSQGEIVGGKVYGRGTTDMKGAAAAMICAAETLKELNVPSTILFTTDEEEKMLGAIELSKHKLVKSAPAIIICEPTDLNVACREKGVFRFKLITKGKAAHSSQCWLGENAIFKMHMLLSRLLDLAETPNGPTSNMTVCFTTIRGGTKDNVVPDRCETEIDIRFPSPSTLAGVERLIRDRLKGLDHEVEVIYGLEPFDSDTNSSVARFLTSYLNSRIVDVPYATEAPRYLPSNRSIFICGPGSPSLAHVADEYVEIRALEKMYSALVELGRKITSRDDYG